MTAKAHWLADRTVLVTGASSGIGLITAREIAKTGAKVVLLVRSEERGKAAIREIDAARGEASGPPSELVLGDLYTMAEVRRAAKEIRERFPKLDVLVNNAGLIHHTRELTSEGLERTFALNHLAPFVLTYELRDVLANAGTKEIPARVVTVSSAAHALSKLDWDDLPYCAKRYGETSVYATSKLCNILFAREASKRFAGKNVTSNSLHPGAVATNFGMTGSALYRVGAKLVRPFLLTAEQGAQTSIYLASSPDVHGITGEYFMRRKIARPTRIARSDEAAERLWRLSEHLTDIAW